MLGDFLVGSRLWWDFLMAGPGDLWPFHQADDKGRSRLESHLGVEMFCWFEEKRIKEIECFRWIFIDKILFATFCTGWFFSDPMSSTSKSNPPRFSSEIQVTKRSKKFWENSKGDSRGASHVCGRYSCVFVTHLCGKHWNFWMELAEMFCFLFGIRAGKSSQIILWALTKCCYVKNIYGTIFQPS